MQPSRRQLLAGAALTLSAACTKHSSSRTRPAAPDPDVALASSAVSREQALLARYDEVLARFPALAAELTPYRTDHVAHLAALQARSPGSSPSASPATTAPAPPAQPVPATLALARSSLADLEQRTAWAHAAGCGGASPDLAGLLASLAACESSHAVLL